MTYLFLAFLLWCGLIFLTVLERKKPSPFWKHLNLALSGLGLFLVLLSRILSGVLISASGQSDTWKQWAEDMYGQHYSVSLPVLFILLGILLISWLLSLAEKIGMLIPGIFLRCTVGLLASAVLLLLAPLYGFMTINEFVPLDTLILLSGIGEALILRLVFALDGYFPRNQRKSK